MGMWRRQPRLGLALISTTYMQGLADWGLFQVLCKKPSRPLPERCEALKPLF